MAWRRQVRAFSTTQVRNRMVRPKPVTVGRRRGVQIQKTLQMEY